MNKCVRRRATGLTVLVILLAGGIIAAIILQPGPDAMTTVIVGAKPAAIAIDEQTGRAFVADSGGNTVSVLDTHSGNVLRTVTVGHTPSAIAVDSRTARVFVADYNDFGVSILDARTGAALALISTSFYPSSLVVDERAGRVLVGYGGNSGGSGPTVLDARTGNYRGSINAGWPTTGLALDERSDHAWVSADGGANSVVTVTDLRSGAILHTVPVGLAPFFAEPSGLAVDQRTRHAFLVNSYEGTVCMIDTRTGRVLHTYRAGRTTTPVPLVQVAAPLAIASRANRVFIAGVDRVIMLDARTGAFLGSTVLGQTPTAMAVDEQTGRVYIASQTFANAGVPGFTGRGHLAIGSGNLNVLDARGRLLRRLRVGVNPRALAVDERDGRIFIVNAGGALRQPGAWAWLPDWLRRLLPIATEPTAIDVRGNVMMLATKR